MINVAPAVSAIATAFSMLGKDITVRKMIGTPSFDPVTGVYTGQTAQDRVFTGVVAGRESRWIAGALVTDADFTVYLKADPALAKPENGEFLMLDGDAVSIQNVDEYRLGDTDLAYRVALVK